MLADIKKAYNYFRDRFNLKKTAQNWYSFDDPFDPNGRGKRKMAVHFQYDFVKCWTYEYRVNITKFIMDYEGVSYVEAKQILARERQAAINLDFLAEVAGEQIQKSAAYMPEGFTSILSGDGILGKRARKYLEDRKFDLNKLDAAGFGYVPLKDSDYFGYIIIPFYRKGLLNYYIGRDYIGNFLRYRNPPKDAFGVGKEEIFYNEDALIKNKKVYLTEGWADAATLGSAGIASLGWSLSKGQKNTLAESKIKHLVIVPDAGFYLQALKTGSQFINNFTVTVANLDLIAEKGAKDVNELAIKGKLDSVFELIQETPPLTLDLVLKETFKEQKRQAKEKRIKLLNEL